MHVYPINHIVRRSIGKALHFLKITSKTVKVSDYELLIFSDVIVRHFYCFHNFLYDYKALLFTMSVSMLYTLFLFICFTFTFLNSRASLLMDVVILVKIRVGKIFIGRMYSLGSKGIRPCTFPIMIHKLPLL